MYNFENILERKDNGSMKWSKEYINKRFKVEYKDEVYPLFIADMDFKLPDEILNKMIEVVKAGDFGYFNVKESLYNAVREWYRREYQVTIKNEWIVPSEGALTCMNLIIDSLFKTGDNILVFTPVYGPFKDVINNNDLNLISNKMLVKDNRYIIDFEKLEEQIKNVQGLILCNPHNPSGRCWSEEEMDRLIHLCKENNVLIISDEVHGDLMLGNKKFISMARYLEEYSKVIVVSSPNKTFNLAGVNISTYICSDKNLREHLQDQFSKKKMHVNRIGCEFLTICYENGYEWLKELRVNIEENLNMVVNRLKDVDVEIIKPDAGYLLWVKFKDVDNIDDFIIDLANEKKVLLETGSRFIQDYEGYLRINVATNRKIVEEGIKRLVDFYNEKHKEEI